MPRLGELSAEKGADTDQRVLAAYQKQCVAEAQEGQCWSLAQWYSVAQDQALQQDEKAKNEVKQEKPELSGGLRGKRKGTTFSLPQTSAWLASLSDFFRPFYPLWNLASFSIEVISGFDTNSFQFKSFQCKFIQLSCSFMYLAYLKERKIITQNVFLIHAQTILVMSYPDFLCNFTP